MMHDSRIKELEVVSLPSQTRDKAAESQWFDSKWTTSSDFGLYSRLVHRLVVGDNIHPTQQRPPQTLGLQRDTDTRTSGEEAGDVGHYESLSVD